jgi:osmotically-inducible protein OsmY
MRSSFLIAVLLFLVSTALFGQSDEAIQASVRKALSAYSIKSIHPSVEKGVVTLTGSVNLCSTRIFADQLASRIRGVQSIRDGVQVLGPVVPDEKLTTQIDKLVADRIRRLGGFGFGSIAANVNHGVVTLSGYAAPQLTLPTVAAVGDIPGVKNLIVHIELIPPVRPGWDDSGALSGAGTSSN